jgi:hypothetical protein
MDWAIKDSSGGTVSESASHFTLGAGSMVGGDPCAEGLDVRPLLAASRFAPGPYSLAIGGVLADGTLCWGDFSAMSPALATLAFDWDGTSAALPIPHDPNCPGI